MSRTGPAAPLAQAIATWEAQTPRGTLVVAIDGHGAAGKSTLAELVAGELTVAVIHVDDFWREAREGAGGPPRSQRPLADYYDWRRLRKEALEPLLGGREARFTAVDPDGGPVFERVVEPRPVILLEGVSAASAQLADLVDRTVLVETPESVRIRRLRSRVPDDAWDEAWLDAEQSYLSTLPRESFDLVVSGTDMGY